jgi:hypothetical protein
MPKPGKISPVLEHIRVASPCNEDWDAMDGNDEVRFCSHCRRSVHNLSAMTRERALELVARSEGRLCVRYVRRNDGSVATTDAAPPAVAFRFPAARHAAGLLLASVLTGAAPLVVPAAPPNAQASSQQKTQSPATASGTGSVLIQAADESGAVIAGADVEIRSVGTEWVMRDKTDENGQAHFGNLAFGDYEVLLRYVGFLDFTATVSVSDSTTKTVNATPSVNGDLSMGILVFPISKTHDWVWHQTERTQIFTFESDPKMLESANANAQPGRCAASAEVQAQLGAGNEPPGDDDTDSTNRLQKAPATPKALFDFIQETYDEDLALPALHEALAAGVNPNFRDRFGDTPLMVACRSIASPKIIAALLQAGSDPNETNLFGVTPSLYAALQGDADTLNVLIGAGAHIDASDSDGRTALMIAVFDGRENFVKVLLDHGANVNARDNAGKSVCDYLQDAWKDAGGDKRYLAIAAMLRHAGALDAPQSLPTDALPGNRP